MPKLVGQTGGGDPIFEVRSVPLVLREGAAHFNRVVACSRCEREVPGPPVLGPTELNQPLQALICRDCVRAATQPAPSASQAAIPTPQPSSTSGNERAVPGQPSRQVADDARLASLEQWVTELAELVRAAAAQTKSQLEAVEDRLRHLELGLDVGAARAEKDSAARLQADDALRAAFAPLGPELVRLDEQLNQRLDRVAERQARMAESEGARLAEADRLVREAVDLVPEALASMRRALQADLEDGLAGVAASLPKPAPDTADRLRALEEAVVERDSDLEELHDLHAALDMGMGELRSGIVAGRAANDRLADALEEVYRRLETVSLAQAEARVEQSRGWRSGRRSGDSTTESAAAVAAIDDLVREQQQLRAQVASLQQAADTATTAAARASSQAAAVGPVRSDVRVLHTKLAEQKEALATLNETVERLRRSIPGPRTAAVKKAPRTTKS